MLSDVTLKVSPTSSYRTAGTDSYIENLITENWADHKKNQKNLVLHWTGENRKNAGTSPRKAANWLWTTKQQQKTKNRRKEKKTKTDIKQATSVNLHHDINLEWSWIYCKMLCVPTRYQSPMLQCHQHDHHSKQRSYWKISTHHKSAGPMASSARVLWEAAEDLGGSSTTSAFLLNLTVSMEIVSSDWTIVFKKWERHNTNKTHYSPEQSQSGTESPCAAAAEP